MDFRVIENYKAGDRIGAPWESQDYDLHNRSYDEIMAREKYYPEGTDETDIVNCFVEFTDVYTYRSINSLISDWLIFQFKKRGKKRYGSSYKDHFELMKFLTSKVNFDLNIILRLAKDRNGNGSFGNGCLALVYPVYCYANKIKQDPANLVIAFTQTIYAHDLALRAVKFLTQIIAAAETSKDFKEIDTDDDYVQEFLDIGLDLTQEQYIQKYPDNIMALHTLFNALYCAYNSNDIREVITLCVNFGGDTDSVLATSMMIFTLK